MAQYGEAHSTYWPARVVFQVHGADRRADFLATQRRIVEMMRRQSRFVQAEAEYRQLLDDAQLKPAIPEMTILALDRLGWLAAQDGSYDEART